VRGYHARADRMHTSWTKVTHVATDHRDQLREYRAKLGDVKEYL
jgi:hypothetical protein